MPLLDIDGDLVSISQNFISGGGDAINVSGVFDITIADNIISNSGIGAIRITDSVNPVVVDNFLENITDVGIECVGVTRPHIVGNVLFDINIDETATAAILLDGTGAAIPARGGVLIGNSIDATLQIGIWISDYENFVVADNKITRNRQHGIRFSDVVTSSLTGNLVNSLGNLADNVSDCYLLDGNSDKNLITANIAVADEPTGFKTRFGFNVSAATCNDNVMVGNFAHIAADFVTAGVAYNDAGTATQVVYPGAAAPQGDNLQI